MLLLKPLAYKVHPYQWRNTIGKDIEHIALANMEEVKGFLSILSLIMLFCLLQAISIPNKHYRG